MKIMKIITIIAIIIFVSLSKKSLLPMGKEIDNMEILKLVGLDYDNNEKENKAALSFMMEKEESSSNAEEAKKEYQEVITYKSISFTEAVRQMQFFSDKNLPGSHVKYFLIGEDTAKNNISDALDIISKDQEVRMAGHVYLTKDKTSQEFLEEIVSSEYKLAEKLASMEEKSGEKTIVNFLTLSDLLSKKLSEPKIYLVPALEISSTDKLTDIKGGEKEDNQNLKKSFNFYGYGIMKDNKLISYIDSKESIIYNILTNQSEGGNVDIETDKNEVISFGLNDINTDYSFEFKNDSLKKVNITINFRSNYEEVHTKENIMFTNEIDKYEKLQEEKIKEQVEKLIYKTKRLDLDIIGIGQKIKMKHPYKYRKLQDTFEKDYKNIEIEVKVNASIDRTYDMVEIN